MKGRSDVKGTKVFVRTGKVRNETGTKARGLTESRTREKRKTVEGETLCRICIRDILRRIRSKEGLKNKTEKTVVKHIYSIITIPLIKTLIEGDDRRVPVSGTYQNGMYD